MPKRHSTQRIMTTISSWMDAGHKNEAEDLARLTLEGPDAAYPGLAVFTGLKPGRGEVVAFMDDRDLYIVGTTN